MSLVSILREANRARLASRHRHRERAQAALSMSALQLSSGQTIKVAAREVHLSGVGSRTFYYRPDSVGDRGVMTQIFETKDYDLHHWPQGRDIIVLFDLLKQRGQLSVIVDMGSNIGASAVFFCERYSGAKLICVEPDQANGDLLLKNMAGLNHVLFRGAISSQRGKVALLDPGNGDWGFRTGAPRSGAAVVAEVDTETVQGLLERWGDGGVPVVAKIDIEGGEADLFSGNCSWMDRFPCIVIELHDWMLPGQGTSRNFLKQVAARELDFVHRGENIFLFNPKLTAELLRHFSV